LQTLFFFVVSLVKVEQKKKVPFILVGLMPALEISQKSNSPVTAGLSHIWRCLLELNGFVP
jgi:hypothetical protein